MIEFAAIGWKNKYYGLPGYGHNKCAVEDAIREGRYITKSELPTRAVCATCHQPLLENSSETTPELPIL